MSLTELIKLNVFINHKILTPLTLKFILILMYACTLIEKLQIRRCMHYNPYPTAFPYGNGMVLHFYQQQESSTTKTVHKVINKGLKTYV